MARLNSTRAIVDKGYDGGEHRSISYRKIDNGYVIDTCVSNYGTGDYKSSSVFSKEKPNFSELKLPKDPQGESTNALSDTKSYLRGK